MATSNASPPENALSIEQLAERLGMTVRNLREWRTLGLLPRAQKVGRVGYYSPEVVERLERVKKLHAEGFTLELISRMLEAGGDAADEVMRLAATLRAPMELEQSPAEAPAERLARVGASLAELGLPDELLQQTLARIEGHAADIAAVFEEVWMLSVWQPFVDAGMPEDDLPRIQETAARMQPLSLETVAAVFAAAMQAQIERGIARELSRATER